MVSDVTLTASMTDAKKTQQSGLKLAEDFTQFLTLLTTQLQNQDPLSPMDSTEFTNQLVQFSQVEQTINTNQKLDSMLAMQMGTISSSMLNYVGMDVSYRSADMHFDGEQPVKVNYALSKDAVTAKMNVYSDKGELVFSKDVDRSVGGHSIQWDGKDSNGQTVDKGTYQVEIAAFDSDDKQIKVSTVVSGKVRGIESQDGVIFLLIGERAVALGNVVNATRSEQTGTNPATETPDTEEQEEAA